MALFITGRSIAPHEWHVGEPFPTGSLAAERVVTIQADGDELDWLRQIIQAWEVVHGEGVWRKKTSTSKPLIDSSGQ